MALFITSPDILADDCIRKCLTDFFDVFEPTGQEEKGTENPIYLVEKQGFNWAPDEVIAVAIRKKDKAFLGKMLVPPLVTEYEVVAVNDTPIGEGGNFSCEAPSDPLKTNVSKG